MNRFFRWTIPMSIWMLSAMIVFTTPGCKCGSHDATHSVLGVVTSVSDGYHNKVELTYKDGTKVKLTNEDEHVIFKNSPIRIDYDKHRRIVHVARLNPPEKDDTVITAIESKKTQKHKIEIDRSITIQISTRPKGTWGVGSTMEEVKALEGEPGEVTVYKYSTDVRWYYHLPDGDKSVLIAAYIEFDGKTGLVTDYKKRDYKFKVSAIPVRMVNRKD